MIMLAVVLCLLLAFSSLFTVGCSKEDEGDSYDNSANHQTTITDLDDWFIKEARCDYSILIKSGADNNLITASIELQTLFREATGITLNITTDEGVTFNEQSKYLSIGANAVSEGAGIVATETNLR